MGHVDSGAFIPDINDTDTQTGRLIPDRQDVSTTQTEHAIDAALGQKLCYKKRHFDGLG
jgi:hypothetical protein